MTGFLPSWEDRFWLGKAWSSSFHQLYLYKTSFAILKWRSRVGEQWWRGKIHGRQVALARITQLKYDRRLVHELGLCPATQQDTWPCLKYILALWQQRIYQGYFEWPDVMRSSAQEVSIIWAPSGSESFWLVKAASPWAATASQQGGFSSVFPQPLITLAALNPHSLLQLCHVLVQLLGGPAHRLPCSGMIRPDARGAEGVIGLLPLLGPIPCYASSHELPDPCDHQQILKVIQLLGRAGWVS